MDRYKQFRINGTVKNIPLIKLKQKISDKTEIYKVGVTRMDLLSYKYYKDANYDWLIMLANPEYGSMEFNIPNNSTIIIPFPLDSTLTEYNSEVNKYITYNGIQ